MDENKAIVKRIKLEEPKPKEQAFGGLTYDEYCEKEFKKNETKTKRRS
jgi:hypothetical protein